MLFRLEHDNPQTKGAATSSRRNEQQLDLQGKRALIKRLQNRLDDFAHSDDRDDGNEDTDFSDDEDLTNSYAPAISNVSSGLEARVSEGPAIRTQDAQTAAAAATLASTLRSRKAGAGDTLSPDTAVTSGSRPSDSSARKGLDNTTLLSPASTKNSPANDKGNTAQLLESHDSEQTAITDSLLYLASQLKNSTLSFSENLDSSDSLVEGAVKNLDKNVTGMADAGKRMGALRRMTEGVGWWGRLSLYARVAVLWVVVILVGLVLPKLRF